MCCNGMRIILMFTFTLLSFVLNGFIPAIPVIYWYFISINIFTFFLFVIDKLYALKDRKRVPEFSLLFFSFAGGFIGSTLAIIITRHKIRKTKFMFIHSFITLMWIITIYFISINQESIQKVLG